MAVRIVIPSQQLREMAKLMTDVAIDYIELAHAVNELADRYAYYLPPSDGGWVVGDIRHLAGRVEDLAYYWEPDIAALLMAARIAEQEEQLVRGWRGALAILGFAYDAMDEIDKRVAKLHATGGALRGSARALTIAKLADELADDVAIKAVGKLVAAATFGLDFYEHWKEGDAFGVALAKASVPLGTGLAGGALGSWACGLFTEAPIVLGLCVGGGAILGGIAGDETVEAYERHFEDN